MKSQSPFSVISNLQVSFHGTPVLHNIDLVLRDEGLTVIVGPSGSGKTTLLRSLNRLNEHYPGYSGKGCVELNLSGKHENIYRADIDITTLRRQVGMVFQTPNVLPTSIARNILLPLKLIKTMDKQAQESRMIEALQEVHLWDEVKDRLKQNATQLSGGQQQRLCFARVLALKPKILLLDEPTASLDFKTSQRIEDLLLELKEQYRIIAVSHSLRQTKKIADQLIIIKSGKIEHSLNKDQFEEPEVLQHLLESIF